MLLSIEQVAGQKQDARNLRGRSRWAYFYETQTWAQSVQECLRRTHPLPQVVLTVSKWHPDF